MKYKYKINLDTLSQVKNFVDITNMYETEIILTNGNDYKVNAKSLLGTMYSIEWNELYVESNIDIYTAIRQFTI